MLVIGAGIAGLRAAEVLVANGRRVIVLEARDRLGGRIYTDRSWGVPVELGASWIHGVENNPIAALAAAKGITTQATDYESAMYGADGQRLGDDALDEIESQVAELVEAGREGSPDTDEPLQAALDRAIAAADLDPSELLNVEMGITESIEHEYATDAVNLSAMNFDDGARRGRRRRAAARGLRQGGRGGGERARRSTWPRRHKRRHLRRSRGRRHLAGHVLRQCGDHHRATRCPQGGLDRIPAGASGRRSRRPSPSSGWATLSKTCLRFESQFWPDDAELIDIVPSASRRGQWVESLSLTGLVDVPALMMFNAGEFARAVETMTDRRGDRECVERAQTGIPGVLRAYRSAPIGMVGRSFFARKLLVHRRRRFAGGPRCTRGPDGRRVFAGEACSRDHAATVHGAYASGEAAAKAVLG